MTLVELQQRCDDILLEDLFGPLAVYWLTHFESNKRQQVNFAVVMLLKELGFDELVASAYQRGLTAGLDIAAHLYRGPVQS